MSRCVEFEDTVKGGLPVLVIASVYRAEPDVGIMHEYAEIEDICWPTGKSVTQKVYDSISEDDMERLAEAATEY